MIARLSLLTIFVAASPALAGPAGVPAVPPAPRAALVEVFESADQALLVDRQSGRYQVVQPGDTFGTFVVTSISRDQVVLTASGSHSFVLPLVSRSALARPAARPWTKAAPAKPAPSPPAAEPAPGEVLNPYADSSAASPQPASPLDPYGAAEPEEPEVIDPYASDERAVIDPYGPDEPAVIDPYASEEIPTVAAPPPSSAPPVPAAQKPPVARAPKPAIRESFSLGRAELDRALEDFASLGKQIRIQRAAGGGIEVLDLARGSLFSRLGLAKGDVVRKVGGRPLTSVDDGAAAYAELLSSSSLQVEIERAGQKRILDIQLTR